MSRKKFIESQGATCQNWRWSWSFVNHDNRLVIFGAWNHMIEGNGIKIMDDTWEFSRKNLRNPAFRQSVEHIRLIQEEGYELNTFSITRSERQQDEFGDEPSKIKSFIPQLETKKLVKDGTKWLAVDPD